MYQWSEAVPAPNTLGTGTVWFVGNGYNTGVPSPSAFRFLDSTFVENHAALGGAETLGGSHQHTSVYYDVASSGMWPIVQAGQSIFRRRVQARFSWSPQPGSLTMNDACCVFWRTKLRPVQLHWNGCNTSTCEPILNESPCTRACVNCAGPIGRSSALEYVTYNNHGKAALGRS